MIFKYPFKAFLVLLTLIIWIGFSRVFAQAVVQLPKFTYPTPQVYPANSPISPLSPTATGGAVPATFFGLVQTFTGTGQFGTSNGGPLVATFRLPSGVAYDGSGNIYIADNSNHLIRKANSIGDVITYAGNGTAGSFNGPAAIATFNHPADVAVDAAGNVYVSDSFSNMIRVITPAGVVSTLAGQIVAGSADGTGTSASFKVPSGIAIDGSGNVYVADAGNNKIRKVTPAGVVTTIAGSGAAGSANGPGNTASFNNPQDVVVDAAGNIYVADYGGNLIRKITPAGVVSTLAGIGARGGTNGAANTASFNGPKGITIDRAGNLFVADYDGNQIRMITPQGLVTTLAGSGARGSFNNTGIVATFNRPTGLTIDGSGNLYVADTYSTVIRIVVTTGYTIDKPLPFGLVFDTSTGIITGTPTQSTPTTVYTITGYNEAGNYSTHVTITVVGSIRPPVPPPAITYTSPDVYTTSTPIIPLSPTNKGGAVPKTTFGQVTTLAGSGVGGSNDGIGSAASFRFPKDVIVTTSGNVDVADDGNYEVRQINSNGLATTFVGSTVPGANDGKGTAASFLGPVSLGLDGDGNIYVADLKNNTIRKIAPDGTVSTFAGSAGVAGAQNGVGAAALFNHPSGVAVDIAKDVFVADQGNNLVRRIASDGTVVTLAGSGAPGSANGTGAQASFNSPTAIAVDATGTVYVADSFNNLIRKITPAGVVTTFAGTLAAGSADGVGTGATFNQPLGIGCEQAGNFIYVGDTRNNTIRMMTPDGTVVTLAGSGAAGSADGDRFQASFNQPAGVSPDGAGDLYVADEGNDLIRKIICTGYIIDKPLPAGLSFDGTTGIISGSPTAVSPATDYKITAFNAGGSSSFTVNITVNQKVLIPQTIMFGPIPVKTYGDADFDAGATSTNNTLPITYTSDNAAVATIVNGLVHITGVGTANITAAQHGNGDYTDASPVTQLLAVKKAPLTIKADNQTRVVGLPNPPLTLTYTGFVYGETPAQLTTQPLVATTAVQASAIGDYPITVDFATSPNYEITQLPGVLTITAVPPTIVIPNTFTPNGDGINDIWNIQSLIDYPQCTVSIYTRYGKLIYESRGYAKPWDGTYNGAQVPVGTYYYIIDPKTGVKQLSGYVTVLR